jgi:putative restriction endonuclease
VSDEALRNACFLSLDVLRATYGDEIPYRGALDQGFRFRRARVPYLTPYKGIYRARQQTGRAALSINTSFKSPYNDAETPEGVSYAYRDAAVEHPDNRALLAAYAEQTPLVYFVATRPGYYSAEYPVFVTADDRDARRVLVAPGKRVGPPDDLEAVSIDDPLERSYAVRETHVRLHQRRFRGRILVAYSNRCAICALKEIRLLDAAHILGDPEDQGEPLVSNGLSLCSIHHRAFDQDLVGISPDYEVRVSQRLLDDEDGPMLELLKAFHTHAIDLPSRRAWQPDRDRLAERFDRFQLAS